jgi:murein DD-endopeptidase MepM/ murein hydrolase activator NlpD
MALIHPTTTSNMGFGFGTAGGGIYAGRVWHGIFFPDFHGGYDYWGPLGYPIWSAGNGTVLYAGFAVPFVGTAGGNGVVISHGNTMKTVYGHMNTVTVQAGQQVIAGQEIGTMGMSGVANGVNHLHFEVRTVTPEWGEDVEDPALFLAGGDLAISGFGLQTEDVPWIEPPPGVAVHMALCQRVAPNMYALPTAGSSVKAVYYDRLTVSPNDYDTDTDGPNMFILTDADLSEEVEVRADYVT